MALPIAFNEGDDVQVQDWCGSPIRMKTSTNQQKVFRTTSNNPTDNRYENWPTNNSESHNKKKGNKEGTGAASNVTGEYCAERFLVVSFAVMLEKTRGRAGSSTTDVIINLLYENNFNLPIFKQTI